ncbi:hypothetical protein FIBSPDRAFT_953398 [Athelia psychrophila]|uniref:Uncharacterized protein n=1 Tax=Athelia psychrophila TaxID=1759441 RepID=A0A166KG59_9AGAM|nr:hypothetical protein FIBSPDRAFT_953398 [Fibularhizoctonia sp. CBS 109695]
MPLVSLPISCVSIAGRQWLPRDPQKQGRLHIHRKGSSLFVRLVGIQEAPGADAMNVDHSSSESNYPPTFNLQNEVEEFTHSHTDDDPWFLILDIVSVRSSKDMLPFRQGPGTARFTCIVGTVFTSQDEKIKTLVHIGTCLALTATTSLKAGVGKDIYHQELQPYANTTSPLNFVVPTLIGPKRTFQLSQEAMNLKDGAFIDADMVDLAFSSIVARMAASSPHGTPVIVHRHLTDTLRDKEDGSAAARPPPYHPVFCDMFPISDDDTWGMFMIITHGGFNDEGRLFDSEGFLILPESHTGDVDQSVAEDLLRTYALSSTQTTTSPRTKLYPTINALPRNIHTEPWRCADRIIHYLLHILRNLEHFYVKLRDGWQAEQLVQTWDASAIDYVRPMLASLIVQYSI